MSGLDPLLQKATAAKRESRQVDFKSAFDPDSAADWCELIKDLVAMANSGGGALVVGADNLGRPTGSDVSALLALDPARITDRVHKYTEVNFGEFEVHPLERGTSTLAVILIGAAQTPMVFCKPGQYADPANPRGQKTAFGQGTLFFRHGAKSETATTDDIRAAIERRTGAERKEFLRNVKLAATAPPGSTVQVVKRPLSGEVRPDGVAVRLTTDPTAPVIGILDYDKTHPYRQRHLVEAVSRLLPKGTVFGAYDVQAIRVIHDVDSNDAFCHVFAFGGRQFSHAFAVWIADRWKADGEFFTKSRATYLERVRSKGAGPWADVKGKR